MLAHAAAHHAIQIRTDAVGAALVGRVARRALGEHRLTCGDRYGFQVQRFLDRHFGFAAGIFRRVDEIARLLPFVQFGIVGMENLAAEAGKAKGADTGKQRPAGDGVETVVHDYPKSLRG